MHVLFYTRSHVHSRQSHFHVYEIFSSVFITRSSFVYFRHMSESSASYVCACLFLFLFGSVVERFQTYVRTKKSEAINYNWGMLLTRLLAVFFIHLKARIDFHLFRFSSECIPEH